jgi:hypothetical protein
MLQQELAQFCPSYNVPAGLPSTKAILVSVVSASSGVNLLLGDCAVHDGLSFSGSLCTETIWEMHHDDLFHRLYAELRELHRLPLIRQH